MPGDAVILGVGTFRTHVPQDEEMPVGALTWRPLEFVDAMAPRVQAALDRLGYRVRCHINPVQDDLRDALQPAGTDPTSGHRIVHVISHGRADPDRQRLDMVPADGRLGRDTNVAGWISDSDAEQRPTLFLVDLCGSGVAARLPSLVHEAGQQTYAWVIAACDGREEAYDGQFSAAVTDVLDALSQTGLGSDPSQEFVDFHLVARHIGMRLEAADGRGQTVRATLMDPSAPPPKLPFFPNPAHPAFATDPTRTRRARLDPPVRDFLEEVDPVDARHFTDRPGRHFTGRRSQLRLLAPWLDDPDAARLCVVTGSPGTGKSAVLGALVCAAHPQLTDQAAHIRERLPGACRPAFHEQLAAVQARQRTLPDVLAALARQLHLPKTADPWTTETFMDALRDLPEPPVLVVDALDEAIDPSHVTQGLLLPLTGACRPGGRPLCRVLLGMRPWEQFHQLTARAQATGLLIDLDQSPRAELKEDLTAYLDDVLTHLDGYRTGPARPIREHLASTAARRLAHTPQQGERWGEFLVAAVFTSYLASTPAADNIDTAQHLGDSVPVTLPDVFELDLTSRPTPATARALLVAVAHAKGNGIPTELAQPLAHSLHPVADPACFPQILDESMFYLRTHVDTDGTTLYRPFHQGLADHLLAHPYQRTSERGLHAPRNDLPAAQLVLDTFLKPRTQADRIVWANAAPYLLRHAIQHAVDAGNIDTLIADAEFLVHADPYTLTAALPIAASQEAILAAAVYRTSLHRHRDTPPDSRRTVLSISAARYGATRLLHQLTRSLPTTAWRPRWATGGALTTALHNTLAGHTGHVAAVACTVLNGRPVAVTGGGHRDGTVRVWDVASGKPIGHPFICHTDHVTAVACTVLNGHPVAVTSGGHRDGTVRVWDLASGEPIGHPLTGHSWQTNTVEACTVLNGRPVAITSGGGYRDSTVRVWDLASGELVWRLPSVHSSRPRTTAVACTVLDGRPVAVIGHSDGIVQVWDLTSDELIKRLPTAHASHSGATAVACTVLDGRPVAVIGSLNGTVQVWDLTSGKPIDHPLTAHTGPVTTVACTVLNGRPVAVTSGGAHGHSTVRVWDLTSGEPIGQELANYSGEKSAVAYTILDERLLIISGYKRDLVQVWDVASVEPVGRPLIGHAKRVNAVACTVLNGRPVAVTGDGGVDDVVRVWDLSLGLPIRSPLAGHHAAVASMTCTVLDGRPVAVTGGESDDGSVRVWDLVLGEPISEPLLGHNGEVNTVAFTVLDSRPVAVTSGGDSDGAVRVWDLTSAEPIGVTLRDDLGRVAMVACTVLDGQPIAVTGSNRGVVRVWDLATREPIGRPLTGHTGAVTAIACTVLNSRPVAVTGGYDHTVRVWDLASNVPLGRPLTGHTGAVTAIACTVLDSRPVAVTGSNDGTLRMWDLLSGACAVLPVGLEIQTVAAAPDGALVLGCGADLCVLEQGEEASE